MKEDTKKLKKECVCVCIFIYLKKKRLRKDDIANTNNFVIYH